MTRASSGSAMKRLRVMLGLTQAQLAKRLGYSRDAIRLIEAGRRRKPLEHVPYAVPPVAAQAGSSLALGLPPWDLDLARAIEEVVPRQLTNEEVAELARFARDLAARQPAGQSRGDDDESAC